MKKPLTAKEIFNKYGKVYDFNSNLNLYKTVEDNENNFIGNQWEGVDSKGLPTPVFNMLKQVVNFQVATITSDNFTLKAEPMPSVINMRERELERICYILTKQYAAIIERNRIVPKMREFLRNAAVDGDGCMYFYFDPKVKNRDQVSGEIVAEITENTRVGFGNPNCREVQKQPWIIISRREMVEDVQAKVEEYKEIGGITDIENEEDLQPDDEVFQNKMDSLTDDKMTVLMYFYRNHKTDTIWYAEATSAGFLRKPVDTGYRLYPIVWINWDFVHDCYHGQSMITGLLPNQRFVNKIFAMFGVSVIAGSFPKIIYDKTKIKKWDGSIGSAVGVNGNVDGVAKVLQGASIDPQVIQSMQVTLDVTKSLLGASDVALGDSRPDNTSAIIALQRAANTPMEMTKQNMYRCIEEMGQIWNDIMSVKYGIRKVEVKLDVDDIGQQPLDMELKDETFIVDFDFDNIRDLDVAIKQDAGASAYWSEIASTQTLDNLLMNGHITLLQYLQRLPNGFITRKQDLIDEIKGMQAQAPAPAAGTGISKEGIDAAPIPIGPGNGRLQRALNAEGV